jgi:outer membrane protein OmpA-like peptidoglycan-associated protein
VTMRYCTHCGQAVDPSLRFCTACGSPVPSQSAPADVSTVYSQPVVMPSMAPALPKKKSHAGLLCVLAAVLVLVAGTIGGLIYAGYKLKETAAGYFHSQPGAEIANRDRAAGTRRQVPAAGGQASNVDAGETDTGNAANILGGLLDKLNGASQEKSNPYDNLKFDAEADYGSMHCELPSSGEPLKPVSDSRIPFVPGLKLTEAWGRPPGDTEIIKTVSEIKPESFRLSSSGLTYLNDNDTKGKQETNVRDVCASDWKNAYGYVTENASYLPPIAPGTTQEILSSAAFHDLKNKGKFDAKYLLYYRSDDHTGVREHWREGTLSRVGDADVDYPVIVNNEAVKLPTILARGTMLVTDKRLQADTENSNNLPTAVEMQVLDDEKNPVVLNYSFANVKFRIQVVKIEYPTNEKKIEQALAKEKKAVIYGIYFDFNSDRIKPESKPVMDEIAAALKDNPDWKLAVNGYTDNIGGSTYNLDLSRRRSASVKQALITQYRIDPDRLTTDGHGDASPVDSNDTLEGRARNRRVELIRQ